MKRTEPVLNRSRPLMTGLLGLVMALGASSGLAGDHDQREHDAIREALKRGEALPLVRILAIAQQAVPGDVIEVELERKQDVLVYEIKMLTQTGRVREVKLDARTGSILKIEDD